MAKPEKIRHTGVALTINGYQASRIQTCNISSDITRDEAQELSNTQIVQYISQTPKVSISIDSNEYGSVKNLAAIVGKNIPFAATSLQDMRHRKGLFQQRYGTYASAYPSGSAARTITESDLIEAYADICVAVTENSTSISRTCWVHKAALSGLTMNFDVNGLATENYTLEADNKTWFLNQYADVRPIMCRTNAIGSSASGATKVSKLFLMATAWGATVVGATVIAVAADSDVYFKYTPAGALVGNYTFGTVYRYGTPDARGHYAVRISTATGSTAFVSSGNPTSKKVMAMVIPATTQRWDLGTTTRPGYKLTTYSTSLGGVSRGYIDIYLYNTEGPAGSTAIAEGTRALRVQTATIDISLSTEVQNELGKDAAYGYYRPSPIPVNVTITANDSDLEMWAKAAALSVTSANEIWLSSFTGANTLVIRVYKEKTKTTLLKTITVPNLTVTSERHNAAVGDLASQEFAFTGSSITIAGSSTDM